jgi:hypothetical protein
VPAKFLMRAILNWYRGLELPEQPLVIGRSFLATTINVMK